VDPRTAAAHALKRKPTGSTQCSLPEEVDPLRSNQHFFSDGEESEQGSNNEADDVPCDDVPDSGDGQPLSEMLVLLYLLDWAVRSKVSLNALEAMWSFLQAVCNIAGCPLSTYRNVKKFIRKQKLERMKVIHVCQNMCVAYYNAKHPDLQAHQHEHRTQCPYCGTARYLPGENKQPRRVMYYFPVKDWIQDMYNIPELIEQSLNNLPVDAFPPGHVRRSYGWRKKVLTNQRMASDARNLALSAYIDGVPYFKDQGCAGGWPLMLSNECLPPGMASKLEYSHMAALVPGHFKYELEDANNQVMQVKRSQRTLKK